MNYNTIFLGIALIILIAVVINRISKSKDENFKKRDN